MYSRKRRFRLFRNPPWAASDNIAKSLSTSLSAYNSAESGSWVKITSTEYNDLQTNVSGTSFAGTTPSTYSTIGTSTNFTSGSLIFTNIVSSATPSIPSNSYIYAVAFYFNGVNSSISVYANSSTTSYTGFSKIGGTLPTTTTGNNYYVLKGGSNLTTTSGNFAMWSNDNVKHGFGIVSDAVGVRYTTTASPSSATSLSSSYTSFPSAFSLQALTTTSKQW